MKTFTFLKTDQWMMPMLAPNTIIIEEDRFDINLAKKTGEKVNEFFTKDGHDVCAYKPEADSGYGDDTVIVRITKRDEEWSVMRSLIESGETYLFKREDWDRVYEVGIARQPQERPQQKKYVYKGNIWGD